MFAFQHFSQSLSGRVSLAMFCPLFLAIRAFLRRAPRWVSRHKRLKHYRLFGLIIAFVCIPRLFAQTEISSYVWQAANFALYYPASWAAPQTAESDAEQILLLSSVAEATPDNPPDDDAFLLLKRIPLTAALPDLYAALRDELAAYNITPIAPLPATWLNTAATEIIGTNANQTQFGTARIALLPDEPALLLMIGRAPYAQRELLRTVFQQTASSLTRGQTPVNAPAYGVLWQTQSLISDGPTAFANLSHLAAGVNDTVFVVDAFAGAVQFDMRTGERLATLPFRLPARPTAIAIAPDESVYVADGQCQCVLRWQGDEWESISDKYASNAPYSLTITPDNTLYATDVDTNGMVFIRVITPEGETRLVFEAPLREQPLLTTDATGRVLVLTPQGEVLGLEGAGFTSLYTLQVNTSGSRYVSLDFNAAGRAAVGLDRGGIVLINAEGAEITRFALPAAASFPPLSLRGVVLGEDGTLYAAQGETGVSLLRAFSQLVLPGRTGAEFLRPALPVSGEFDTVLRQQVWFFEAERGAIIDLTTFARPDAFNLDLALRLLAPDGDEVAFVDNMEPTPERFISNPSSPFLHNLELAQTGLYTVIIERINGTGGYELSLASQQSLEFVDDAVTVVSGQLSDAVPVQRYAFEGRAGQIVTITLSTNSPQLDPVLFLRDTQGDIVAQNDNALDPALRQNAQIVEFELPRSGTYVIEATRFRGFGQYLLEILPSD